MGGDDTDFMCDDDILEIRSPRERLGGPHVVAYKHHDERWAIVALDWDGRPTLGMRWFHGSMGNPHSSGYPTWCIIPDGLIRNLLSGLPLSFKLRYLLDEFLLGRMTGDDFIKAHAGDAAKQE